MFFSPSIKESVPELIPGWNIWIISAIHTLVDGFSRSYEIRTFGRYLHIALRVHCVDEAGIWLIVFIVGIQRKCVTEMNEASFTRGARQCWLRDRRTGVWHHIYQSALLGCQVKVLWRLFPWYSLAAPRVGIIDIFLHGMDFKTSCRVELTRLIIKPNMLCYSG